MSKMICVKTFPNREIAELCASQLSEIGIKAVVSADDGGGAYSSLDFSGSGVMLLVMEDQASKAREFLDSPAEELPDEMQGE